MNTDYVQRYGALFWQDQAAFSLKDLDSFLDRMGFKREVIIFEGVSMAEVTGPVNGFYVMVHYGLDRIERENPHSYKAELDLFLCLLAGAVSDGQQIMGRA